MLKNLEETMSRFWRHFRQFIYKTTTAIRVSSPEKNRKCYFMDAKNCKFLNYEYHFNRVFFHLFPARFPWQSRSLSEYVCHSTMCVCRNRMQAFTSLKGFLFFLLSCIKEIVKHMQYTGHYIPLLLN